MTDYKIENNQKTGGFCCDFEHGGKKYYADLSYVPFNGTTIGHTSYYE